MKLIRAITVAAASILLIPTLAGATPITYNITVTVTSAPLAPGSFASNPWSFGTLPGVFVGSFTADDTVAGPISNLALTIGGLNLAVSNPLTSFNSFNPGTLILNLFRYDQNAVESLVVFGPGTGQPANRVVAIQNSNFGTPDPYTGNTMNWEGTFAIDAVPEPATLLLLGTGLAALVARRRYAKRT